jgi:hypothetical protein
VKVADINYGYLGGDLREWPGCFAGYHDQRIEFNFILEQIGLNAVNVALGSEWQQGTE